MIADLARQGLAIILISSELPELIGMCDRIVVLREGRITAELAGAPRRRRSACCDAATDAAGAAAGPARHAIADPMPSPSSDPPRWLRSGSSSGASSACSLAMVAVIVPVVAVNPRMLSGANLTALAMDAALLDDRRGRRRCS